MYIKLKTEIPNLQDLKDYQTFSKYEARSMQGQLPVIWDRAKDVIVYDRYGNEFLDFTSGICVANVGHGNEAICNGLKTLIDKPLLHSYTFATEIRYWFLRELVETCYPNGKAFLVSAGTEATEVAVKLMRMYGLKQDKGEDCLILSIANSMHGRTYVAENLKGYSEDNEWATKPKNFLFERIIANNSQDWFGRFVRPEKIAGIIIESYRGWSSQFYSKKFIQDLVKYCKQNDIIVCFDEIQGGFGRTGKMWAWEHYDIPQPDLICFGKGVSSSIPLSGVLGRADLLDIPDVGSMSSTHSANPISCIAGLKNLLELKRLNLIKESRKKGMILHRFLYKNFKNRYKIYGKGLLASIITNTVEEADKIVWECFKRGLLLIWTHQNAVKLAPPLIIKKDALLEGLEIIKEVINENS